MISPDLRQLKLDLITDMPNPLQEWFKVLWSQLYVVKTDAYHNNGSETIFYINVAGEKQWIFYQDHNGFWCNYEYYWEKVANNVKGFFRDIQDITKLLVENSLGNTISIPNTDYSRSLKKVNQALLRVSGIPIHKVKF